MAPEQWKKEPIGEWTSVFVVGIILHELMSRGVHPIGDHGCAWHRRKNPGFNRWQKNKYWTRWVEKNCPIGEPIPDNDLAHLVADCLNTEPSHRPGLANVQNRLRDALASRSSLANDQAELFLKMAEEQTSPNNWSHLNGRLMLLRRAIEAEHTDPRSSA